MPFHLSSARPPDQAVGAVFAFLHTTLGHVVIAFAAHVVATSLRAGAGGRKRHAIGDGTKDEKAKAKRGWAALSGAEQASQGFADVVPSSFGRWASGASAVGSLLLYCMRGTAPALQEDLGAHGLPRKALVSHPVRV